MCKKATKSILGLALVLALVFSMTACSSGAENGGNSKTGKADQQVTLTLYHIWAGGDAKADIMTKVLDTFMRENKNIKLDIQTDSSQAYMSKIRTYAASGSVPDVTFLYSYSTLTSIAKSKSIADLTSVLNSDNEWKSAFKDGALESMNVGGNIYGVPVEGNAEGVFYNKALFDKFGVTYPKTYTELKQVVQKFKANGIIPISLFGKEDFSGLFQVQYFLDRQAGTDTLTKILNKNEKFSNPDYIKAFTKFSELSKLGAFPQNIASISYDQSRQLFVQGKAAMIIDGTWDIPQYDAKGKEDFAKNIEFAAFPAFEDGKGNTDAVCKNYANGFGMSSKLQGAKKDAAIKLLKFLSYGDGAKLFADNKVIVSTNVKADESNMGILLPKVLKVMNSTKTFMQYNDDMTDAMGQKYLEANQELVVGGNPEDILKKLDTATANLSK